MDLYNLLLIVPAMLLALALLLVFIAFKQYSSAELLAVAIEWFQANKWSLALYAFLIFLLWVFILR